MDMHFQILQLCLPLLAPNDVAILRCVCREFSVMHVCWRAHGDIHFKLDGCPSGISWLHKNIVSMREVYLTLTFNPPKQLLQDLVAAGRLLTDLRIESQDIEVLPALPAKLDRLSVAGCRNLCSLPELPPTLDSLDCDSCPALTALPASFTSTAVSHLCCNSCSNLEHIPRLPGCILHIEANYCRKLEQLPELPEGFSGLDVDHCTALVKLPELPASMSCLSCDGCVLLRALPELAHTGIAFLGFSGCSLLTDIPALPPRLEYLHAAGLPLLRHLPALPTWGLDMVCLQNSGLVELPDPLPWIDELHCSNKHIQRLPVVEGCKRLVASGCKHLQHLAEPLPASLIHLDCSGCTALQQLPTQLPDDLETLNVSTCTALERLPAELPQTLCTLNREGCSSLQQLPDLTGSGLRELRIKGCSALKEVQVGGCESLVVHLC